MPVKYRRLNYYVLHPLIWKDGGNSLQYGGSVSDALLEIHGLPADYTTVPNRYMALRDGNDMYVKVDHYDAYIVRGEFALKRRANLAPIEMAGALSPLQLAKYEGLAEIRHFVYWRNTSVLGIEYNHYAPGIRRFVDYLATQGGDHLAHLEAEMVLGGDAMEQLNALTQTTTVRVRMPASAVQAIPTTAPQLRKSFRTLRQQSPSSSVLTVEVQLDGRRAKKTRESLGGLMADVKTLLADAGLREQVDVAEVKGYETVDGNIQQVDALADRLQTRVPIELEDGTDQTSAQAAYAEIEYAYADLGVEDAI